jgi:hypothetical protein
LALRRQTKQLDALGFVPVANEEIPEASYRLWGVVSAYEYKEGGFRPLDWQTRRAMRWAAWRPDGSAALLVGNNGSALLFDGTGLDVLATGTRQNLRGAAWSPDGTTALLVGNRGAILVLDGEEMRELEPVTSENLRRVAWHPHGDEALVIGNAGVVLRYERHTGIVQALPGDRAHTLRSLAYRPDGSYALVGAYASRWAGYPRPHALYRCDGRYLQGLLATDDEDDLVAVDWSSTGRALACGYAQRRDGETINKALLFDGSSWQTRAWAARGRLVLGGAWRPGSGQALLVGEAGLALTLTPEGGIEELDTGSNDNLIGPFWRPDGASAIVLKGPGDRVYTV